MQWSSGEIGSSTRQLTSKVIFRDSRFIFQFSDDGSDLGLSTDDDPCLFTRKPSSHLESTTFGKEDPLDPSSVNERLDSMEGLPLANTGSDEFGVNFSTTLLEPTAHDVMSLEMNNMNEYLDPRSFGGNSMDFDDFGQSSSIYDMQPSSFDVSVKMEEPTEMKFSEFEQQQSQSNMYELPRNMSTVTSYVVKTESQFMPVRTVLTHQSPSKQFSTPRKSTSSRSSIKKEPLDPQRVEDEVARNVSQILSATKQQRLAAEAQQRHGGVQQAPPTPRVSFSCSGCNKSLTSSRNLQRHRQSCPVARGIIPQQNPQPTQQMPNIMPPPSPIMKQSTMNMNTTTVYEYKPDDHFTSEWSRSDTYSGPQSVASDRVGMGSIDDDSSIDQSFNIRGRLEDNCLPLSLDVDETTAPPSSSASLSSSSTGTSSAQFPCESCKKSVSSLRSLKRHHSTCKQYIAEFGPPPDSEPKKVLPAKTAATRKRKYQPKVKKEEIEDDDSDVVVVDTVYQPQPTTSAPQKSNSIVEYVNKMQPTVPATSSMVIRTFEQSINTTSQFHQPMPIVKVVTGYGSGMTVEQSYNTSVQYPAMPPQHHQQQFMFPAQPAYYPYYQRPQQQQQPFQQININTTFQPSPSASSLPSITSSTWFPTNVPPPVQETSPSNPTRKERCDSPDSTGMPKTALHNNTCEDCSRQLCSASNLKRHRATCKAAKERINNGSTPSSNPATPMTPSSFQMNSQPMTPARILPVQQQQPQSQPQQIQQQQPQIQQQHQQQLQQPQVQQQIHQAQQAPVQNHAGSQDATITYTPKPQNPTNVWPQSASELPAKDRSIIERSYAAAIASAKEPAPTTTRQRTSSQNYLAGEQSQRGFITVGEHLRAQHVQQQKLHQQQQMSAGPSQVAHQPNHHQSHQMGMLQHQTQHQQQPMQQHHLVHQNNQKPQQNEEHQHQVHQQQPVQQDYNNRGTSKMLAAGGVIEHQRNEEVQITSTPLMNKSYFDSSAFSDLGSEEDLSYVDFETIDEDLIKAFDDEINNGNSMFSGISMDPEPCSMAPRCSAPTQPQHHQQQHQQQAPPPQQTLLVEINSSNPTSSNSCPKIDTRANVRIETKSLDPQKPTAVFSPRTDKPEHVKTEEKISHMDSIITSVPLLTQPNPPPPSSQQPAARHVAEPTLSGLLSNYSAPPVSTRKESNTEFQCPECLKMYSCRKNVKRHRMAVHKLTPEEIARNPIPGQQVSMVSPGAGTTTAQQVANRRHTMPESTISYTPQQNAIIVHTPTFYHAKSQPQAPPSQPTGNAPNQQESENTWGAQQQQQQWRREDESVETARIAAELKRSAESEFEVVDMTEKKPKTELAEADSTFTEDNDKGTLTTLVPLSTNLGSPPSSLFMSTSSSSMASSLPGINSWNEFEERPHVQQSIYQPVPRVQPPPPVVQQIPQPQIQQQQQHHQQPHVQQQQHMIQQHQNLPTPQQMANNAVESVVNTQKSMGHPIARSRKVVDPAQKKIHSCHGCNRLLSSDYSLRRHRSTCPELKNMIDKNPPASSQQGAVNQGNNMVTQHKDNMVTVTSKPLSDQLLDNESKNAYMSGDVPDSTTSQRHDRSTSPGMGMHMYSNGMSMDDDDMDHEMLLSGQRKRSNSGGQPGSRQYQCPACGKWMSSEWNLDRHRRESCVLTDRETLPPPPKHLYPQVQHEQRSSDDFHIIVRGIKFKLSRALMNRTSGYFQQFFSMYDHPKGDMKIDLDPEWFKAFLLVLEGIAAVSKTNIEEVSEIAFRLKFSSVWETCERFITDSLPHQSIMHAIRLADKYKLMSLKHKLFAQISMEEYRLLAADPQYRIMEPELKAELLEQWGSVL